MSEILELIFEIVVAYVVVAFIIKIIRQALRASLGGGAGGRPDARGAAPRPGEPLGGRTIVDAEWEEITDEPGSPANPPAGASSAGSDRRAGK